MVMTTESPTSTVSLHWPLTDEEFTKLCVLNPEMRLEYTSPGDLVIMPPAGGETSSSNAELIYYFVAWRKAVGSGRIFDSSGGFMLPNGAKRSPDVSWINDERWESLSLDQQRGLVPLCPDFVLELRSPSDRLRPLQVKMEEYRDNGARLGWLIDPFERVVYVYRPGEAVERHNDPREASGEPVLAGFVLRLSDIW